MKSAGYGKRESCGSICIRDGVAYINRVCTSFVARLLLVDVEGEV
jgi:hypothetical protein